MEATSLQVGRRAAQPRRRIPQILRVEDIANLFGWEYRKTKRWLLKKDKDLGGAVLTREGAGKQTRYLITRSALRVICPDLFDPELQVLDDLPELRAKVRDAASEIRFVASEAGKRMAQIERENRELRRQIQAMKGPKAA